MPAARAVEKAAEIRYAAVLCSVDAITRKVNNDRCESVGPISGALPAVDLSLAPLAGAAMHHERSMRTMAAPDSLLNHQANWRTRAIFATRSALPGIAKVTVDGQNEAQAPGRASAWNASRRFHAAAPGR
jgi:hypothetical protein